MKLYIDEKSFLQSSGNNLISPMTYYRNFLIWWFRRLLTYSNSDFTYDKNKADFLISNGEYIEDLKSYQTNICLVTDSFHSIDKDFTLNNNTRILNMTKNEVHVAETKIYSAISNLPIQDIKSYKIKAFSFCVFIETSAEALEILRYIESKKICCAVYCFYDRKSSFDESIANTINKHNLNNKSQSFRLYYLHSFANNFGFILDLINRSKFIVCVNSNLVYPFWAQKLGVYPVVSKFHPMSRYLKTMPNQDTLLDIINSFWVYPRELASFNSAVKEIKVEDMTIEYLKNVLLS